MSTIYGNPIGGIGRERTYIIVDEDGNEIPAVVTDMEVVFDAGENDIRAGKVAASANGVVTGTKEIPAYHTTEGAKAITAGSECTITLPTDNRYDYTKLQIIICAYNSSLSNSVAAEKVCINDNVYAVGSTESLSTVSTDDENKSINLGISNEGSSPIILRYFTYREEY